MADTIKCPYQDAGCTYSARLSTTMQSHVENSHHLHTSLLLESLKQVHARLCQVESEVEATRTELSASQTEVETIRAEFSAAEVQFQKDFSDIASEQKSMQEELEIVKAELETLRGDVVPDRKTSAKLPAARSPLHKPPASSTVKVASTFPSSQTPLVQPASTIIPGKRRSMFATPGFVPKSEPSPQLISSKSSGSVKRRYKAEAEEVDTMSASEAKRRHKAEPAETAVKPLTPEGKRWRKAQAEETAMKSTSTQVSVRSRGNDDLVVDGGVCEWSVQKWSSVLDEAKQSGGRVDKTGPIFYCCAEGYRFQLKMRVYGGGGVDHSLSILEGEYDEKNSWPVPHDISVEDCRGKKRQWTEVARCTPDWIRHLQDSEDSDEEQEILYNAKLAYHKPAVGRDGTYLWRLIVHHE